MIYDIIFIAVILISLIVGYNKGAAKMLCSFLGSLVSVIISALLGDYLSSIIYNGFISQSIVDSVADSLTIGNVSNAQVFDSLPPFVRFTLELTSFDAEKSVSVTESVPLTIAKSVEKAVAQPVISLLSVIISLALFFVVFYLFRFVFSKIINMIFNLPVIRTFNKLLGSVCSVLCGLVFVSFAAFLLSVVMPYFNDVPYIFSESTIYNSYIFYHFYSGNIFTKLISIL